MSLLPRSCDFLALVSPFNPNALQPNPPPSFCCCHVYLQIPVSLVYRADLQPSTDSPPPALLYGYGSYSICIDPWFSITRLPYLDRGMAYAIAHVRGGGEMVRPPLVCACRGMRVCVCCGCKAGTGGG